MHCRLLVSGSLFSRRVYLSVPHPGIAIEFAVKSKRLYRLLNELRIVNETAEIRAEQAKAKIPQASGPLHKAATG
jgi:hypothetical protein